MLLQLYHCILKHSLHFFSGQIKHHHQRHGHNTDQSCHYIDSTGIDRFPVVQLRQLYNRCCRRCDHCHQADQKNRLSVFHKRCQWQIFQKQQYDQRRHHHFQDRDQIDSGMTENIFPFYLCHSHSKHDHTYRS